MNEKVNLFIAMAPAASPKGFSHPLLDGFVKAAPSIIYCLLGRKIFLKSVVFWQRIISPPIFVKLIDGAVHFLFGWHCKNMSQDQKLVSYQHLFSMTSVKSIVVSKKKEHYVCLNTQILYIALVPDHQLWKISNV